MIEMSLSEMVARERVRRFFMQKSEEFSLNDIITEIIATSISDLITPQLIKEELGRALTYKKILKKGNIFIVNTDLEPPKRKINVSAIVREYINGVTVVSIDDLYNHLEEIDIVQIRCALRVAHERGQIYRIHRGLYCNVPRLLEENYAALNEELKWCYGLFMIKKYIVEKPFFYIDDVIEHFPFIRGIHLLVSSDEMKKYITKVRIGKYAVSQEKLAVHLKKLGLNTSYYEKMTSLSAKMERIQEGSIYASVRKDLRQRTGKVKIADVIKDFGKVNEGIVRACYFNARKEGWLNRVGRGIYEVDHEKLMMFEDEKNQNLCKLQLIRNYIKNKPFFTLQELIKAFPDINSSLVCKGINEEIAKGNVTRVERGCYFIVF